MIPANLPLPDSSPTHNMSQSEKKDLADQWYAMMIKEDADEHEVHSTLSTLSSSVISSKEDLLQEQRDPMHVYRSLEEDRLLEKGRDMRRRDHSQEQYPLRKSRSQNYQTQQQRSQRRDPNNYSSPRKPSKHSKTDFLDGIIKSLSEVSRNETKSQSSESKQSSSLSEKKMGWSIHDSERRFLRSVEAEQQRSRRNMEGTEINSPSDGEFEAQRRRRKQSSQNEYYDSSQSLPSMRRESRGRASERRQDFDANNRRSVERDSRLAGSKPRSHSSVNSRSHRSSRTAPTPGHPSNVSLPKTRSWNVDKSLFDSIPISPETASSIDRSDDQPLLHQQQNQKQRGSLKASGQPEGKQGAFPESSGPRSNMENYSALHNRLAFSSSKDAGKILKHFMPNSCGPVNGGATFESLGEYFDMPARPKSTRNSRRNSSGDAFGQRSRVEHYPSRPRTTTAQGYKQMHDSFSEGGDYKLPKTDAQKKHEEEILRNMQMFSNSKLPPTENFAQWEPPDQRDAPPEMLNVPNLNEDVRQSPQFATNFGALAASVLPRPGSKNNDRKSGVDEMFIHQLKRCHDVRQESPPKISNPNLRDESSNEGSSSALSMFEKIQRQLTGQTKIDSSGFPMEENLDTDKSFEQQEQRTKLKLDAVRARSMRNAQIFQQMDTSGENHTPKDKEEFFGEANADQKSLGIKNANESENSKKKNGNGKRLEINTLLVENVATSRATPSSSSSGLVLQHGTYENETNHYMYVAYSQFGQDAQKVLKLCGHHSLPTPGRKGEVLVRILVSTVSAIDCAIRRGEWKNVSMDPYIIPGVAFVGKVIGKEKKKSRSSSSSIESGDTVLSLATSGANARYSCVSKTNLIRVSSKLNPERIVCLAETYLTAFQALHLGQRGALRYRDNSLQGKSILVMGGYSPFGKAIVELSRIGGASICYALIGDDFQKEKGGESSNEMHHRFQVLEQWGAIPLSNDPQDWLTLIGRQIDIFITTYDPNQGRSNITEDHWKALKKDGQVHVVCSHPGMTELEQRNLILGSQSANKGNEAKAFRIPSCRPGGREKMADRALYYNLFDSWEGDRSSRATARKDLEHLLKLLEVELIHPEIAERIPLSKVAKAQRSLEHYRFAGEGHLICSPWLREKTKEQQKGRKKKQQIGKEKFLV